MKKINEQRINDTYKYIKDYYASHNVCPTYREIKNELNYKSLSLVHADVERLKEKKLLVDDEYKRLTLASEKDKRTRHFNFPFLIMSEASHYTEFLNEEESKLLEAQDYYLKGDFELAQKLSNELLNTSKNNSIYFGAKLTLCWSAFCSGKVEYWKDFFRSMLNHEAASISEKMEKELVAHFLTSLISTQDNCPKWLNDGRFDDLRLDAYPLATILFVTRSLNSKNPDAPRFLEPFSSIVRLNKIDIIQVYMDLKFAIAYYYSGQTEYLDDHLNAAIETCLKHKWLIPLAEVRKTLGSIMCPILDKLEPGLIDKVDALAKVLATGYDIICKELVWDNPSKHFTFREVEIINYVYMDFTTKEIADKLYLSPETVKYYLSSIYLKLGVSGRKELKEVIKKYV